MGLFGKIFDKKTCAICGGEIGLLGNRKLEDGDCCKECARKLSVWFDDRRHSTVDEIKAQLEYRENNKKAVKKFHTTRVISADSWNVLLDEDAANFIVTKNPRKLEEENPDVISYSDLTGCRMDIDEDQEEIKREVKHGDETSYVSYNPPRYKYEYKFHYKINVNNPYFDDMEFDLNDWTVEIEPMVSSGGFLAGSSSSDPKQSPEFEKYNSLGGEITKALNGARTSSRQEQVKAKTTKVMVCPFCGAQTEVGADGKCEYCGGYIAQS